MKEKEVFSLSHLTPKETYRKISDISLDYLIDDVNIKGLIFDFDGTLFQHKRISVETLNFLKKAKERGLKISVVSNNIHVSNTILKTINITTTKKFACKPLKKPFLDMAKRMKLTPDKIAVIGNNRFSDIWGANRAGMYSIYIQDMDNYFFKRKVKFSLKDIGIKHID